MINEEKLRRIDSLLRRLPQLSASQILTIDNIVQQFERPTDYMQNPASDLVSSCILTEFGDALRIHHCFSREPFTKDKFEYALERVCNFCDVPAMLAPKGNPGHDITIAGVRFSLKTQADKYIKASAIHISKFMELGKGQWGSDVNDLDDLRQRFFHHMLAYDRILTLRKLRGTNAHTYELVEIPKPLLAEAASGELKMDFDSTQSPKPGTCTVVDDEGSVKFQLYFDGGTERKLQVRQLNKALCTVHATWNFEDGTTPSQMSVF